MRLKKATVVVRMAVAGALALLASAPALAQLSADDFLPPAQAKTEADRAALRDVKQADAVKAETDAATGAPAVRAGSFQDAINAAAKGIKGTGCAVALHEGNRGWVARGVGAYSVMQSPVATRLSKRQAYVTAFMVAKTQLAGALDGLSHDGRNAVREDLKTINDETKSLKNFNVESEESLSQAVECLLRGFVVYDVSDDGNGSASVTIVTTPRTRGKYSRPNPNSIEAASMADGLNAALSEISSGIVPLTGGKVVSVPSTGEVAFVGYGSAVVESDDNSALQARLNLAAEKSARARALDSLCGTIIGDEVKSVHAESEQTQESMKDFDEITKNDPLARPDAADAKQLENRVRTFRSDFQQTDQYESVRSGKIPPGVNVKTWSDPNNDFAYAAAVYVPSLSKMAEQDKKEMQKGSIVEQDKAAQSPDGGQAARGPAFKDGNNPNVPRPGGDVKPGPTGRVQDGSQL